MPKNFTRAAANAAEKFFSNVEDTTANGNADQNEATNDDKQTHQEKDTNSDKHTHQDKKTDIENNTKQAHVANKSKHYDERGKREERYGLLLDKQLKEDLKHLANATGSRSINDFIVTILLEYVEATANQELLEAYKNVLKLKK